MIFLIILKPSNHYCDPKDTLQACVLAFIPAVELCKFGKPHKNVSEFLSDGTGSRSDGSRRVEDTAHDSTGDKVEQEPVTTLLMF